MGSKPIESVNLEHLYHSYLVEAGRPVGKPRLVAHSPGAGEDIWKECLKLAPIQPFGTDDISGTDSDTVGIFRGHTVGRILAHARRDRSESGVSNIPTVHYLLLPEHVLDVPGTNTEILLKLIAQDVPTFSAPTAELPPYSFPTPSPPTIKQQMRAFTSLLTRCQNDTRTVRGLLASIVQGEALAVVNCNAPLKTRIQFFRGLLALLPTPARAWVTLATHVSTGRPGPAQVKFLTRGAVPPDGHQVFDWEQGVLTTSPPHDPYSSFAVGQIQLNPIGFSKRLVALADTTRHHMASHTLTEALARVARRATMDTALAEGQPLYRDDVFNLLETDPTLPPEIRAGYAGYLLRVTLALDEPEPADVLIPLIQEDRGLATAMFAQLEQSLPEGQAGAAYHLLKRWLDKAPDLLEAWPRIFGAVSLAYQQTLVKADDIRGVATLLTELEHAPAKFELEPFMSKILLAGLPFARKNSRIARAVLRLAAHHLEAREFDVLIADDAFVNQLPAPVQTALTYLDPDKPIEGSGRGVLLRAGKALGERGVVVLARLAENAMAVKRQELVDVPALEALRQLAQSPYAGRFAEILRQTVSALVRSEELTTLPEPGPLLLAQIMFLLDRPDDLAELLASYQHKLFGALRRDEFRQLLRALFQVTPVSAEQAIAALKALESFGDIDRHGLALAYRSTLHAHDWSPATAYAVEVLLAQMDDRAELAVTLGFPFTVELFRYVADSGKKDDLVRVAKPLFDYLPEDASQAAPVLRRVWPLLAKDPGIRDTAIELLRVYARRIPAEQAVKLLRLFKSKRTRRERNALEAMLVLRPVFETRDLRTLAKQVREAVGLFGDFLASFEYNPPPGPKLLTKETRALTGRLSKRDVAKLSAQAMALADYIEQLGRAHNKDNTKESLIANQAVPRSGIGLLYWLGGYFAEGEHKEQEIDNNALQHPFGNRSAPVVYREIDSAAHLLADLLAAFPVDKPPAFDLTALHGEIDSRWENVRVIERRKIQKSLARDCQTLARILTEMARTGGSTTFLGADISKQVIQGKVAPQSVVDALRWVSGFYAGKHKKD